MSAGSMSHAHEDYRDATTGLPSIGKVNLIEQSVAALAMVDILTKELRTAIAPNP